MNFPIEKIIAHLKDLSPKNRASVIDHTLVLLAGCLLLKESFLGSGFDNLTNQIGFFASYVAFGLSMMSIFGSLYGCNFIVHRLSHYD